MKSLILPALGAALVLGAPPAVADDIFLAQLMIIGQPGQSGSANRTLPSGSAGIAPLNMPTPGPFAFPSPPTYAQPTPFIGERGELNYAEPEFAGPAERDETGRLRPSVDRARARFAGERDAEGKLLPTFVPQQAQLGPSQQTPAAPRPTELKRESPPGTAPGIAPGTTQRSEPSGQATGTTGTGQKSEMSKSGSGAMSPRATPEAERTAALNALSAEGYTPVGRLEKVGNAWQTTATREGRQVTVQIDPQTNRITER